MQAHDNSYKYKQVQIFLHKTTAVTLSECNTP